MKIKSNEINIYVPRLCLPAPTEPVKGQTVFSYCGANLWNCLERELKYYHRKTFKKKLST